VLTALFGIAAWAVNLVLASRIRPVERAIGGLEHLYRLHRRLGLSVVALATAHVLFLTLHAEGDALGLYLPSAGWGTFTGVIAFVLLLGFVVASLARRLEYQTFTLVQRLLGVAFMLGAVHTFAVHSTPASSPLLTVYLAALTGAGCVSLGYRLLGGAFGIARSRYRVDEVRRLGEDLVEVVLLPVGRGLQYQAGQFVYATFHQSGIPQESHPFTIASAPDEPAVRIAVKRLGDFTGSIMTLRSGAPVTLEETSRAVRTPRSCRSADVGRGRDRHYAFSELGPQPRPPCRSGPLLLHARARRRVLPRRAPRDRRPLPRIQGDPGAQPLPRTPDGK
jgi:predicted ferric reductase